MLEPVGIPIPDHSALAINDSFVSEFLVAIAPKAYDRLAIIDVGRKLQKIVIDATRMGLTTCWIGPGADHASIVRHLGGRLDPEKDHIVCVCAVGYPSRYIPLFLRIFNNATRRRLPLADLFFADPDLQKPLDLSAEPYCRFGRAYETCQWAPSSYNGQMTRCVVVTDEEGTGTGQATARLPIDFYAVTASRYDAAVAVGIWCANWEMGCKALGISGRLAVLRPEARGVEDAAALPALPQYDISGVLDRKS